MKNMINNIDWVNAEAMKYWSFPASYSKEKKKTELKNAIFSGEYYGALKIDGYYQRLVKDEDGNCFMVARSKGVNGAINKYEWVPQLHSFMNMLPNGTVLLCECYLPNNEGSKKVTTLLGCLKDKCIQRQEIGQKLHFYIFDVCAWDGVNFIDVSAFERFSKISEYKKQLQHEYVEWAEYYNGAELWNKLEEYLASGHEGMVITHKDCPIYFKRTPAHKTIKVKTEITETIDCFFTGHGTRPTKEYSGKEIESWKYWISTIDGSKLTEGEHWKDYNEGAAIEPVTKPYYYGWCGSLEIGLVKDNKVVPIGLLSGLEDELKANPEAQKGKVIEVSAMEIGRDDAGKFTGLRHAKLIGFRTDKTWKECEWEQIG